MMWLPYLIRNWCRGGCNTASPALLPVSVMAGAKLGRVLINRPAMSASRQTGH
jgi:hypothetical protein